MGITESSAFNQRQFRNNFQVKTKNSFNRTIWQSIETPQLQLQQYPIIVNNQQQALLHKELFHLRKDNQQLVKAYYFKQTKQQGLCSTSAQGKLFLEHIQIRLSDLQHVPYPDILHLYSNVLVGMRKLARKVGYFKVLEEQIGFTIQGVAKVWLDSDFSAIRPSLIELSQSSMVNSILQLIADNTDQQTIPQSIPSIIQFICGENQSTSNTSTTSLTFDDALISLRSFANMYNNGQIPKYMECIRQVGVGNILRSLSVKESYVKRNVVEGSMAMDRSGCLVRSQVPTGYRSTVVLNGVSSQLHNQSHVRTYDQYQKEQNQQQIPQQQVQLQPQQQQIPHLATTNIPNPTLPPQPQSSTSQHFKQIVYLSTKTNPAISNIQTNPTSSIVRPTMVQVIRSPQKMRTINMVLNRAESDKFIGVQSSLSSTQLMKSPISGSTVIHSPNSKQIIYQPQLPTHIIQQNQPPKNSMIRKPVTEVIRPNNKKNNSILHGQQFHKSIIIQSPSRSVVLNSLHSGVVHNNIQQSVNRNIEQQHAQQSQTLNLNGNILQSRLQQSQQQFQTIAHHAQVIVDTNNNKHQILEGHYIQHESQQLVDQVKINNNVFNQLAQQLPAPTSQQQQQQQKQQSSHNDLQQQHTEHQALGKDNFEEEHIYVDNCAAQEEKIVVKQSLQQGLNNRNSSQLNNYPNETSKSYSNQEIKPPQQFNNNIPSFLQNYNNPSSSQQYHNVRPYIPPIQLARTPSQKRMIQNTVKLPSPLPFISQAPLNTHNINTQQSVKQSLSQSENFSQSQEQQHHALQELLQVKQKYVTEIISEREEQTQRKQPTSPMRLLQEVQFIGKRVQITKLIVEEQQHQQHYHSRQVQQEQQQQHLPQQHSHQHQQQQKQQSIELQQEQNLHQVGTGQNFEQYADILNSEQQIQNQLTKQKQNRQSSQYQQLQKHMQQQQSNDNQEVPQPITINKRQSKLGVQSNIISLQISAKNNQQIEQQSQHSQQQPQPQTNIQQQHQNQLKSPQSQSQPQQQTNQHYTNYNNYTNPNLPPMYTPIDRYMYKQQSHHELTTTYDPIVQSKLYHLTGDCQHNINNHQQQQYCEGKQQQNKQQLSLQQSPLQRKYEPSTLDSYLKHTFNINSNNNTPQLLKQQPLTHSYSKLNQSQEDKGQQPSTSQMSINKKTQTNINNAEMKNNKSSNLPIEQEQQQQPLIFTRHGLEYYQTTTKTIEISNSSVSASNRSNNIQYFNDDYIPNSNSNNKSYFNKYSSKKYDGLQSQQQSQQLPRKQSIMSYNDTHYNDSSSKVNYYNNFNTDSNSSNNNGPYNYNANYNNYNSNDYVQKKPTDNSRDIIDLQDGKSPQNLLAEIRRMSTSSNKQETPYQYQYQYGTPSSSLSYQYNPTQSVSTTIGQSIPLDRNNGTDKSWEKKYEKMSGDNYKYGQNDYDTPTSNTGNYNSQYYSYQYQQPYTNSTQQQQKQQNHQSHKQQQQFEQQQQYRLGEYIYQQQEYRVNLDPQILADIQKLNS